MRWVQQVSEDDRILGNMYPRWIWVPYHHELTSGLRHSWEWDIGSGIRIKRQTNIFKSYDLRINYLSTNSLAALLWKWYLNSDRAALQATGWWFQEVLDGTERNPPNLAYTCVAGMTRRLQYITWKNAPRRRYERHLKENHRTKNNLAGSENKFDNLVCVILSYIVKINRFSSRINLVLQPTLYKFIIWVVKVWVQFSFGINTISVPTNVNWKLIWDLLMLIVLKLFSNKWHLLTILLISLKIFWICEWD